MATASLGVFAATASAGDVWLWACQGPSGQAINSKPDSAQTLDGQQILAPSGCGTAPTKLQFTKSTPAATSSASVTFNVPSGLNAKAVKVERSTRGFDGAAGDAKYALEFDGRELESRTVGAGNLAGGLLELPNSAGSGGLTFKLSTTSGATTSAGVDIVRVAFLVSDTSAPDGGVNRNNPVDKGMPILPNFMDSGVGLDYAVVSVDGYPELTQLRKFGKQGDPTCDELSPGDATNDRPLDTNRCHTGITSFTKVSTADDDTKGKLVADPIIIDSLKLPAGFHKRNVTVYDAAGNETRVIVGEEFEVWHPEAPVAERTLNISTSSVTELPSGGGTTPGGGVQGAQRNQCRTPRLSILLSSKPVRVSRGVPVLKYKKAYRFKGRLTCVINGKRQSAPKRTKVSIFNKVGSKTVRKPNTAIRSKGAVDLKLAFLSSRTVIFRYTNADGQKSEVKIKVRVTKGKK